MDPQTRPLKPAKSKLHLKNQPNPHSKSQAKPKQKSLTKHRYDWMPDLPDHRDFNFSEQIALPERIPDLVDLRAQCSPVENQGNMGSCTGNAIAGLVEFLELADLKTHNDAEPEVFNDGQYSGQHSGPYSNVSRLFIYYNERELSGTTGSDSGSTIRNGMKAIATWGVCREKLWSYTDNHLLEKPAAKAYGEGAKHRIGSYLRISDLETGLQCLATGFPFVFGFTVFQSFESPEVAKTGIVPLPTKGEQVLGGHAVMAAGYDLNKEWLIVRNSWGVKWGDHGYFYMPFAYLTTLHLAQDFWTIRN